MNRLEEHGQAVSHALESQVQRIEHVEEELATTQNQVEEQLHQVNDHVKEMVREELRKLSAGERSLIAVAPVLLEIHSGVEAKPYPYNRKMLWDVYYMQFENIARMNNWSNEEKVCVLISMLEARRQLFWNISPRQIYVLWQDSICSKVTLWRYSLNRAIVWLTALPD
nr:unnamed protein product [Callosobruchus chinensis]